MLKKLPKSFFYLYRCILLVYSILQKHNMMELYEGTTIMNIVAECQKEFHQRYFGMEPNDWRHLICDYVRKVTERPNLQEEEVFRYVMAI